MNTNRIPNFRWVPGMLAADTGLRFDEFTRLEDWEAEEVDLNDVATLACVHLLVFGEGIVRFLRVKLEVELD